MDGYVVLVSCRIIDKGVSTIPMVYYMSDLFDTHTFITFLLHIWTFKTPIVSKNTFSIYLLKFVFHIKLLLQMWLLCLGFVCYEKVVDGRYNNIK